MSTLIPIPSKTTKKTASIINVNQLVLKVHDESVHVALKHLGTLQYSVLITETLFEQ